MNGERRPSSTIESSSHKAIQSKKAPWELPEIVPIGQLDDLTGSGVVALSLEDEQDSETSDHAARYD